MVEVEELTVWLDDVQLGQSDGFAWYPDEFAYLVTSSFIKEF
jgi:hypothetical protein